MSTVIVEMKTLCKNKVLTDLVKTPLEYIFLEYILEYIFSEYIFLFAIITSKYKNTEQYTTNKKKSERKKKIRYKWKLFMSQYLHVY